MTRRNITARVTGYNVRSDIYRRKSEPMNTNLLCILIGHRKSLKFEVSRDKSCCRYVYVCKRCGYRKIRSVYDHESIKPWIFKGVSACRLQKRCVSCDWIKTLEEYPHKDAPWNFTEEGKCDQKQVCPHCKKLNAERKLHTYQNDDGTLNENIRTVFEKCDEFLVCERCGEKQKIRNHCEMTEVAEKNTTPCHHYFICGKCGKEKNEYNHTRVESGHRIDEKGRTWESHETTYRCSVCGDETKEYELVYTDW
jgi:hypothetical protein